MRQFALYVMRGKMRDQNVDTREVLTLSDLPRIGEAIYYGEPLRVVAVNWIPIGHSVDVEVVCRPLVDDLYPHSGE